MKLLLIEDSRDRADLLMETLHASGAAAHWHRVTNATELQGALGTGRYDAVVCNSALAEIGVAGMLESSRDADGNRPIFVVLDAEEEITIDSLSGLTTPGVPSRQEEYLSVVRATMDAAPDAMLLFDFATRTRIANKNFSAMWNVDATHAPRAFPPAIRLAVELLECDPHSESSGTLDLADGRSIEWFSSPQLLAGRAIGRLWSFRDVTSRVAAQRGLEQSEANYRSLIGNIPDVLWTADARGRISFVSPSVLALDGYAPEEICAGGASGWLSRVHPDDEAGVARAYSDLFVNELSFDVEYRIRHKDGRWIWVHDRAMSTYELRGVRCADGVISDITARKNEEFERKRLGHERELLLDSAAEGIYGVDREGRITFANAAALAMLEYTIEELLGSPVETLCHESFAGRCAVHEAIEGGQVRRVVEEPLRRRNGETFLAEYVASPIIDGGEVRGAVVLFNDITQRRALEKGLEQANRVASLGRVAATIAHEFNNVLMGISPFAEIVRRSAGESEKLANAAEHIIRSVQRGKRVAQEILRFTRPAPPLLKRVNVNKALQDLAGELCASVPRECHLELRLPEAELEIAADWPQLEQVIANLVVNARDAMNGAGTIVLALSDAAGSELARRRVADPERFIHLLCRDTGAGMTPAVLDRIFEPLFTTKRSGTGLGLAVAHQVVTRHGGLIFVESEVGKGTTFHLLIRKDGIGDVAVTSPGTTATAGTASEA